MNHISREILLSRLKRFEGEVTNEYGNHVPYKDMHGNLTIGYGHNLKNGIYTTVAQYLLELDINYAIDDCLRYIKDFYNYPEDVQIVLVDMMFNMGWSRPKGQKGGLSSLKTFLNAIKINDYKSASHFLWDSTKPREKQRYKYARDVGKRARENAQLLYSAK